MLLRSRLVCVADCCCFVVSPAIMPYRLRCRPLTVVCLGAWVLPKTNEKSHRRNILEMSLNMVGIAYYVHLWPRGQAFHSFYQILQVSEAAGGFTGNARMFFKSFHVWKCEVSETGAQLGDWVLAEGWALGVAYHAPRCTHTFLEWRGGTNTCRRWRRQRGLYFICIKFSTPMATQKSPCPTI